MFIGFQPVVMRWRCCGVLIVLHRACGGAIGGAAVALWPHVPMQGVGVLCGAGGSTGIHREAPVMELV